MKRLLLAAALAVSCSHTRPAELTAQEHRNEARVHEHNAQNEAARYDASRSVQQPTSPPASAGPGAKWFYEYNPTQRHLEAADRELRQAAEHLAAARALEAYEGAACRAIPPAERAACPLLASSVARVRDTRTGLELFLKPTVDAADTQRRLSCHLAYAEANGFERPAGPLFVKGVRIALREPDVLVFTGANPAVVRELQGQARRIFAPEVVAPAAVSMNR